MQIIVGIKNDYKWFKFVYSMQPNNQKKKKKNWQFQPKYPLFYAVVEMDIFLIHH